MGFDPFQYDVVAVDEDLFMKAEGVRLAIECLAKMARRRLGREAPWGDGVVARWLQKASEIWVENPKGFFAKEGKGCH
jgi:hypothetical protein